jgi:predicted permease
VLSVFLVTFPFFALIAAGYAAARLRWLPLEAIPGLNTFVLYFALPCMLYRFGAGTPIAQLLDGRVLLVWGLSAGLLVAGVVCFTRNARIGWNDASFGAMVAAFSNTGFMGVPLITALLGAQVAGPIIVTIVFDVFVTSSACIALSRLDGSGKHGASRALGQSLKGVFANPLPWSILLGALASAAQFRLPGPAERSVAMLADAASPAALFTIGAVLARSAMLAGRHDGSAAVAAALGSGTQRAPQAPLADVLPVVAAKLFAHPLLVWGAARAAAAVGYPLSTQAEVAIMLVAALPSASNVAMLAERFGADSGRIARIILWSTAAAFFTFPLVVGWVR